MNLREFIRDIPDFPKPGVVFKDITPLLGDGVALHWTVDQFRERYRGKVDMVFGIESRGFVIGAAVAYALGVGLGLVRKKGKLPSQTYTAEYELEYGSSVLEIQCDALAGRSRVLLIDDLIATGGTARAAVELIGRLHGEVVECAFIIELGFLYGRRRLQPHPVYSLVNYDRE
jgi:adenine phosphoribosyltransferase